MISLLRLIARYMAVLTVLAAILAYVFPETFSLFGYVFKEMFALTMFSLGIVLNRDDLRVTIKHPTRIVLGVITQFIFMPALAFSLVSLVGLPPSLALGFIIVGSAPGAMASNVIVYLAGGALAFSITLTTVATFLSPLVTPYLMGLLGGETIPINALGLMWTILYILVMPLSGGMLVRYYLDKGFKQPVMIIHIISAADNTGYILFIFQSGLLANIFIESVCALVTVTGLVDATSICTINVFMDQRTRTGTGRTRNYCYLCLRAGQEQTSDCRCRTVGFCASDPVKSSGLSGRLVAGKALSL